MIEAVGVRFKRVGKIYYFDPKGLDIPAGTRVIVETVRGLEIGDVVLANRMVEEDEKLMPLSPVIRIATPADIAEDENNMRKEKEAFAVCEDKIKKHGLVMKLIDVEFTFDNNKIIFSKNSFSSSSSVTALCVCPESPSTTRTNSPFGSFCSYNPTAPSSVVNTASS